MKRESTRSGIKQKDKCKVNGMLKGKRSSSVTFESLEQIACSRTCL
jgi:hypothetical protein